MSYKLATLAVCDVCKKKRPTRNGRLAGHYFVGKVMCEGSNQLTEVKDAS